MMRKRGLAVSILLASALLFAGCGAEKYLRRGDALMLENRPIEAAKDYQTALDKDRKLADDPDFVTRFKRAKCLAALQEAQAAAGRGAWDEAVRKYTESLGVDPAFEDAKRGLEQAKLEASRAHHRKALEAARQGRQDEAVAELKTALQLNPANAEAAEALNSVTGAQRPAGQDPYEKGLALEREKKLPEAAEAFRAALAANANHIPAAVGLFRAEQALAQSAQLAAKGRSLLEDKRLEEAIQTLSAALAIWPASPEAARLLADARTRRDQAEREFASAQALANQSKWEEAAAALRRAVDLYPYHKDAQALLRDIPRRAAQALVGQGNESLAKGQPNEADQAFRRALEYVPGFAPARQGLARVAASRGEAAAAQGLWGSALMFFMDAADQDPGPQNQRRVQEAKAKIQERVAFAMDLNVTDASGRPTAASDELAAALRGLVNKEKPAFLSLAGGTQGAAYLATVTLNEFDVRGGLVRTEERVQRYTVRQSVPNAAYPVVQQQSAVAQHDLAQLQMLYNRPCSACAGTGRLACPTCGGACQSVCPSCKGAGFLICGTCKGAGGVNGLICPVCGGHGKATCGACGGAKKVACPTCSAGGQRRGWVPCMKCTGRGRDPRVPWMVLRQKEDEVAALQAQLARTPPLMAVDSPAEWPYTVDFYAKDGRAGADLGVKNASGASVASDTVRKAAHFEDTGVRNPNPQVGVAAKSAQLPSDDQVRRGLIGDVATEAAGKLLSAVFQARVKEVRAAAEKLQADGKRNEAVEAFLDGATLLEPFNPQQSQDILKQLRSAGKAPAK
jgi:tetratricopeptide (TPR) repeat protein